MRSTSDGPAIGTGPAAEAGKAADAYFVVYRHTVYDHDYDHDTHGHNNAAEEHYGHHDHNYGADVLLGTSDVVLDAIDPFDNPCDHYYPGGSKGHVGHGNFEVVEILEIVDKHFDDQCLAGSKGHGGAGVILTLLETKMRRRRTRMKLMMMMIFSSCVLTSSSSCHHMRPFVISEIVKIRQTLFTFT